jgi:S-adenosylmethionine hydrolase
VNNVSRLLALLVLDLPTKKETNKYRDTLISQHMPIITLTTDFGQRDAYAAILKAVILKGAENVQIVDISHGIRRYQVPEASFVLKSAWRQFPDGTIHIATVDAITPEETEENVEVENLERVANKPEALSEWVGMEKDRQFFLAPDNGILSVIAEGKFDALVTLDIRPEVISFTFPARDILVPAALHLARGGALQILGKTRPTLADIGFPHSFSGPNSIDGAIVYIDGYGNAITNIHRDTFDLVSRGRPFKIRTKTGHDIEEISLHYSEVPFGQMLAIFGADGWLEIAIHLGHTGQLLGHHPGDNIHIQFY